MIVKRWNDVTCMAITKEYFAIWNGLNDYGIICFDVQSLKELRIVNSPYSLYGKAQAIGYTRFSTRQMKFAPVNTHLGNCLILCDDEKISLVGYNQKSNTFAQCDFRNYFEHDGRCVSFDIDQGLGILLELVD